MTEQEVHERGLALFLVGEWRARFRESLAPKKRRSKLRSQLPHFAHLDGRFATLIPTTEQTSDAIGAQLRAKGAGDRCFLLSEDGDLDGRETSLDDALAAVVDGNVHLATFISCVPGRLAYFHDEKPTSRYLLEHPG